MWDMCLDGSVYLPVRPGTQGHGSSCGRDWPKSGAFWGEKMSCKSDKWLTFLEAVEYRSWHGASSQIVNCSAQRRPNKILIKHHKKKKKVQSSQPHPLFIYLTSQGLMAAPVPALPKASQHKILCISRQQFNKITNHICPFIHFQNQAESEHNGGAVSSVR